MRLLQKMGWRPGRGVAMAPAAPAAMGADEAARKRRKWGTVAGVSLDNTPLYVLEPKVRVAGLTLSLR